MDVVREEKPAPLPVLSQGGDTGDPDVTEIKQQIAKTKLRLFFFFFFAYLQCLYTHTPDILTASGVCSHF